MLIWREMTTRRTGEVVHLRGAQVEGYWIIQVLDGPGGVPVERSLKACHDLDLAIKGALIRAGLLSGDYETGTESKVGRRK